MPSTSFKVILKASVAFKLNVAKIVKDLTGLGWKEVKALVDSATKPVNRGIDQTAAKEIVVKLKEAGANVEIV
ncbi:MAG TPA: ribosomal protein L7/L12 [Flavisolibacter sp.]|nr:ribosomal protein L7/L12 [Flavisolibacter sp.]